MRAMILAAGLGTRLCPITDFFPKPLVPVAGVPNLERLIRHLAAAGLREIVINLHHMGQAIADHLGDGARLGVTLSYSHEAEILGTGGGIKRALPLLGDGPFVVFNGDSLFAPDLQRIIACHRAHGGLATLGLRPDKDAVTYGAVGVDARGQLTRLAAYDSGRACAGLYMFTGVHVIDPALGLSLPDAGCIVRRTYIPLLQAGTPLHGLALDGDFLDLGTPERYLAANVGLLEGSLRIAGFTPPPSAVLIAEDVVVPPSCHLGHGTVIGAGAVLSSGVRLERAVVLPGATVARDVRSGIVLPDGRVVEV